MPAPVSIVIATHNSAEMLPALFGRVFEGVVEGFVAEVILADGGSTDATRHIAEETGARVVSTQPELAAQLNAGADAAKAPWLFCLDPAAGLSPDWFAPMADHIQSTPNEAAKVLLKGPKPGSWRHAIAGAFNAPPDVSADQALLIPSRLLARIGGFEMHKGKARITHKLKVGTLKAAG